MGFRFRAVNAAWKTYRNLNRSNDGFKRHLIPPAVDHLNRFTISRRWHMGDHSHHHHRAEGKDADGVFKLGLAADTALSAGKALTGYLSGSTAIIADAAHSVSDIILSGVALWSFRAARVPKDNEHPYGHGKFETLGTLGISCMLLATAGGIAWHAAHVLQGLLVSAPDIINHSMAHQHDSHGHVGHHHGIDLDHPVLALSMTITSIFVKEGLYWITKRAGDRGGSELMKANAWHHRADAVSSVVALIGVGGAILGIPFLDPFAGLVVSGMILKAGIGIGYQSLTELVDTGVPLPILEPIKQTILQVEGVKGCHRLRGRKAGSSLYLDVHIEVDPFLSVSAAHDIGENVRHQIQKSHNEVVEVFIHIDPSLSELSNTMCDQERNLETVGWRHDSNNFQKKDVEGLVFAIFASQFPEMTVEHILWHSLQGKVFLQIQVSMPPTMLIRDAKAIAQEAEKEILATDCSINQACIQLRLSHPICQFGQERAYCKGKQGN
uniref:Metal tolerance protein C1 n=1 Tax=Anthurium amnicola TaxID=1678845 RepID=A0A1D1ZHC0_9ARAE